mmetsp:Transcript_33897/g.107677  ORF Transcript_33897/g.107677 Transcript_33897/m.107677 type:complete len:115 (+) Transcript_33897:214-558(+)
MGEKEAMAARLAASAVVAQPAKEEAAPVFRADRKWRASMATVQALKRIDILRRPSPQERLKIYAAQNAEREAAQARSLARQQSRGARPVAAAGESGPGPDAGGYAARAAHAQAW